jgi:predicted nucleic acid-binding protein
VVAEVFVDTAGWANIFVRTEPKHEKASHLFHEWRRQNHRLVTSNYVLVELVALLTQPFRVPRPNQFRYIETVRLAPYVEVVHVDEALDAAGWALLKARPDKEWSLVDAVSFMIMQQRGIMEALTTDHHFEQAGFIRLL